MLERLTSRVAATCLFVGLFVCLAARSSDAALSVDFDAAGATGQTQAGFQSFAVSMDPTPGPVTRTFAALDPAVAPGNVTVTVAAGTGGIASTGNLLTRERGAIADAGAFTYGNLYRDLLIATGTSATTLNLGLSGLNPSTEYDVTLYAFDRNHSLTPTFQNVTAGATGPSATYTSTTTVTSNEQFGRTLRVTSSAAGDLAFRITNSGGNSMQGILNGFEVRAVPEPTAAAALLGAATAGLLARRRGRPAR